MSRQENPQRELEVPGDDMGAHLGDTFAEDAFFDYDAAASSSVFTDGGDPANNYFDMSAWSTDMGTGQPGGIQGGDWAPLPTSQAPDYLSAAATSLGLSALQSTEVLPASPPPELSAPAVAAVAAKKPCKPRAAREPKKKASPKPTVAKVAKATKKATKKTSGHRAPPTPTNSERTILELYNSRWSGLAMGEKHRLLLPLLSGVDPNTGVKIGAAGAFLPPPDFESIGKDLFNSGTTNIFAAGNSVATNDTGNDDFFARAGAAMGTSAFPVLVEEYTARQSDEERARIDKIARRIMAAKKNKMTQQRIATTTSSPAANMTSENTSFTNGDFQNVDTSQNTNELSNSYISSLLANYNKDTANTDVCNTFPNLETLNNTNSFDIVNTNSSDNNSFGSSGFNSESFDVGNFNVGSFNTDNSNTTSLTNSFSSDTFGTGGFSSSGFNADNFNTTNFTDSFNSNAFGTDGFPPLDTSNFNSDTSNFNSDTFVTGTLDNPFGDSTFANISSTFDDMLKGSPKINTPSVNLAPGTQGCRSNLFGNFDSFSCPPMTEDDYDFDKPTSTKGFHGNLGGPCGNGIITANGVMTQIPIPSSVYGATRQQEALERNAMLRAQGRRR